MPGITKSWNLGHHWNILVYTRLGTGPPTPQSSFLVGRHRQAPFDYSRSSLRHLLGYQTISFVLTDIWNSTALYLDFLPLSLNEEKTPSGQLPPPPCPVASAAWHALGFHPYNPTSLHVGVTCPTSAVLLWAQQDSSFMHWCVFCNVNSRQTKTVPHCNTSQEMYETSQLFPTGFKPTLQACSTSVPSLPPISL